VPGDRVLFAVSVASVVKRSQRRRATGSAAAKQMSGWRQLRLRSERACLLARLAEKPDLTPGAGVLAALRHDRITAPCVTDDRSMAPSFALRSSNSCGPLERGDIVVSDNLGSHKGTAVRRLIRGAGRQAVLPARYSPDLNPIEQVFAKLKTLLRRPAHYQGHLARYRRAPRPLHSRGMRQLPRQCGLCSRLTGSRSMVSRTRLGAAVADGEHLDLLDAGGGAQLDDVALPRL